jgi:hypothetical protein
LADLVAEIIPELVELVELRLQLDRWDGRG